MFSILQFATFSIQENVLEKKNKKFEATES